MGQVAVFNPGANVPAFIKQAGISAVAKALAGGSGATGDRLSIKGGVFRLVTDGKEVAAVEERYLDVVIVNSAPKISRTFYAKAYNPDEVSGPDCSSADGETPDKHIKNPQAKSCATCPKNVKGSGQGDSKACRYSQRVAVVLANDMEGKVLQLSLPALSIFGKAEGENRPLQEYARWLIAQGIDPTMLVTRLKFDTKSESPKLFFKPMRWLEQDEFALCQKQGATEAAIKAISSDPAQLDGAPPAEAPVSIPGKKPTAAPAPAADDDDEAPPPPAKKTRAAAPVPAPAPAADDDDEAPPPPPKKTRAAAPAPAADDSDGEPVVRKAAAPAPAATPDAGSSLAATLAAWDDED